MADALTVVNFVIPWFMLSQANLALPSELPPYWSRDLILRSTILADALYTSVKPAIADGGRMIIISTARGEGNLFHKLWKAADQRANSFAPLFLPWSARPDRTAEWYKQTEADAISRTVRDVNLWPMH